LVPLAATVHNVTEGSLEIGLDGEEAVKSIFSDNDPTVDAPCFDLIMDIRRKIAALPITVTGRHIKGHQDKGKELHELDRWARLNVAMDEKAKALLRKRREAGYQSTPQPFGQEPLVVSFKGTKLSRFDLHTMYTETYGEETKALWAERHHISPQAMESIDWKASHKALKREPLGKRRWLCKHISGHCGVGRQLLRRHWQDHDHCPLCDQPDETTKHVVTCPDVRAANCWLEGVDALATWLRNELTNRHLIDAILHRLDSWHYDLPNQPVVGPPQLQAVIAEQDSIGWENFLFGRVTKSMAPYQHTHFFNLKNLFR